MKVFKVKVTADNRADETIDVYAMDAMSAVHVVKATNMHATMVEVVADDAADLRALAHAGAVLREESAPLAVR